MPAPVVGDGPSCHSPVMAGQRSGCALLMAMAEYHW